MADQTYPFDPDWCIRPGDILREMLSASNMTVEQVAAHTSLNVEHVHGILEGRIPIRPGSARCLATLGINDQFWLNLEARYRDGLAAGKVDASDPLPDEPLALTLDERVDRILDPEVRRYALISDDGRYRYTLDRAWHLPIEPVRPMVFVMLNPSTADATEDDPTVRRCLGFARREACNYVRIVNLFALRATQPLDVKAALSSTVMSAVGPDNTEAIRDAAEFAAKLDGLVVVAWGAHEWASPRARIVAVQLQQAGVELRCLGVTKGGAPRHPLYVPSAAPLVRWPAT